VNVDELLGTLLMGHEEPEVAARTLAALLADSSRTDEEVARAGFDPLLVRAVASRLPQDPATIELACATGASWARGRRSSGDADHWELVASWSDDAPLPAGVRRTTGEVLSAIIASAVESVYMVSPFVDRAGLEHLLDAIGLASRRGAMVHLVLGSRDGIRLAGWMRSRMRQNSDPSRLRFSVPAADRPWLHLKVAVADARKAYLGSANLTAAAMTGRNVELGVLLSGPSVQTLADFVARLAAGTTPV
jgi:phosphatidylserine/phosphatidylglycerophosphate/cardiolipin synthase-like enzyme